jgi:hypothetical protein
MDMILKHQDIWTSPLQIIDLTRYKIDHDCDKKQGPFTSAIGLVNLALANES